MNSVVPALRTLEQSVAWRNWFALAWVNEEYISMWASLKAPLTHLQNIGL